MVEAPLAAALIAAGRTILRQVRCPAGQIDIWDATNNRLFECKARGSSGSVADAASQLRRYAPHYPGAQLIIAVPRIEPEALWLADLLEANGFVFLEIEAGSEI